MASLIPDGDAAPRTNPDEAALRQHLRQNARAASHTLNQRAAARRQQRAHIPGAAAERAAGRGAKWTTSRRSLRTKLM